MSWRHVWSRLFPRKTSRAPHLIRRPRPRLERLEDRTLPAVSLLFDAAAGNLSILGDASDHTVRQGLSTAGFLEVAVDGQQHSSDPKSAFFDPALAGANADSFTEIRFDGGGPGTLILGSEALAGGLTVVSDANITVDGAVQAGSITLEGSSWVNVEAGGSLVAGRIDVSAGVFVNGGQMHADGPSGGQITVSAAKVLDAGPITADGTAPGGDGGSVRITFTDSYIATTAALTSADGSAAGHGGQVVIDGGATGELFSSGREEAVGSAGGSVDLFGRSVVLVGATVDASGDFGGGSIRIGGDYQGGNPAVVNAQTVTVTGATTLKADARSSGAGGRVIVWSDQGTQFDGSVSARGGASAGGGGFIEVSGKGNLTYGGTADAGAAAGNAGTLLLDPKNLVIDARAGVVPQFDLIDPHPTVGGQFGTGLTRLSNGNVVVTNPNDNFGGTNAGAVYLFNGLTGALISSLVGSSPGDFLGYYVTILSSGNYLARSPSWSGNRGAVTWGSGTAGVSGTISAANSLVGSDPGDYVGEYVTVLSNGNYLVGSPLWNGSRGAVTWGSGTAGVSGVVSAANSLVGSNSNDSVGAMDTYYGSYGITVLSSGNYLVRSPFWNGNRGAVTWGSGTAGVSGVVSAANSLVGGNPRDDVGYYVTALGNGNYLVDSPAWNGGRGAVTFVPGSDGFTGVVSAANSLVGSDPGDSVGAAGTNGGVGVTVLSDGNYVVDSPLWNGNRGAVTWGSGTVGVSGTISAANSLVGSGPGDLIGAINIYDDHADIVVLSDGNYLVGSPQWNGNRGAATWGSGTAGVSGTVSAANSLVGSSPNDYVGDFGYDHSYVSVLSSGNYLVRTPQWNGDRGAVTWGSGTAGVSGVVSAANSLVGSNPNDSVGAGNMYGVAGITVLSSGNYVVRSPFWSGNRGAVTWGSGTAGVSGVVSAANSLVGSNPNDSVGAGDMYGVAGIILLSSGNYVVRSPSWNGGQGAVTWGSGTAGVSGPVSAANSLVGGSLGG
jgi:hypothetical protein